MKLEATRLRNGWAVRPEDQLGTCGFYPRAWQVCYVKAATAQDAIKKAQGKVFSKC
jgi:hypothetical protein